MTELIYKSFPHYQKIKLKMSKYRDSLDSRMSGFNMLCSLLSIKNILDQSVMHKCLNLIIDCFEKSMSNPGQRKELQQFYKEIDMKDCILKDDQANCIAVQHYYSKLFHHCMVQGLLLILTNQHEVLSTLEMQEKNRKTILQKIIKIIFKQGMAYGGLPLCSQTILCDFLKEYEKNPFIERYVF